MSHDVAAAIERVQARIEIACRRSGRDPGSVQLVSVSKGHPEELIRLAYDAGMRVFGENYAQELAAKAASLNDLPDIRWRFIVPVMCGIYLVAGLFIIVTNFDQVGAAFGKIVGQAFNPQAGFGGMLGVLVTGFRRAAFSNEAGVGSASIAHSAAATDEPVREGIVALLEPFIDTILVCTMTGLVVVITGAYEEGGNEGVLMTSKAFATVIPWFPKVLSLAVFLFAFSTMISWSYYGERCWTFLFGAQFSILYKIIFLAAVVFGSVLKLGNVIDFSDLMILGMSFPNILGAVLLSGKVREALTSYWNRYKSGEMQPRG